jgi:histidine decarboxylase
MHNKPCRSKPRLALALALFIITSLAALPAWAGGPPPALTLEQVVNGAVGPFERYCDGYGNPGASGLGYISLLKLEVGMSPADMDPVLDGIVAYDRAEATGAYIGQINMITASSFNGINGAVWGYHLAVEDSIADGSLKPLFMAKRPDGKMIPVYSMEPLLKAGKALLGTVQAQRFPALPGAHITCAAKSDTANGPTTVWCAAALAIAEDRGKASNLFMEDKGHDKKLMNNPKAKQKFVEGLYNNIVKSVMRCGQDSLVKYKAIFVGHRMLDVPAGQVGCALTVAPYLVLAKKALPDPKNPAKLLKMTLSEWEKNMGFTKK